MRTLSLLFLACCASLAPAADEGWIDLFNGHDLSGWQASEPAQTFRVEDGKIVAVGQMSHLYYVGEVENADFKDFELECEVLTKPGSNSGVFFHTEPQASGSVKKGYEAQISNSHTDVRRTGSLFAIQDHLNDSPVGDDEWFTMNIRVAGKRIVIRVNDEVISDFTEPEDWQPPRGRDGRLLSSGTIALQGHDPGSTVWFRKVRIKPMR